MGAHAVQPVEGLSYDRVRFPDESTANTSAFPSPLVHANGSEATTCVPIAVMVGNALPFQSVWTTSPVALRANPGGLPEGFMIAEGSPSMAVLELTTEKAGYPAVSE
jgi:hypothetical protein